MSFKVLLRFKKDDLVTYPQFCLMKQGSYVIAKCCEMFFVEMNEQSANNAL